MPVPGPQGIEEFDHARGLKGDQVMHLATLDFLAAKENVLFLGPPSTGKNPLGDRAGDPWLPSRVLFATSQLG